MASRTRVFLFGLVVAALALVAAGLWLSRPDPKLAVVIGLGDETGDFRQSAIELRVIEAEIRTWEDRQFQLLATELAQGEGVMARLRNWIWINVPILRDSMGSLFAQRDRRPVILRVLAMAGPRAMLADWAVESAAMVPSGYLAEVAPVTLARIRNMDPDELPKVVPWMKRTSPTDLGYLWGFWTEVATNPPASLIPHLILSLNSKRDDGRLWAARALARFGTNAHAAAPALRRLLADPSKKVRPSAALALGSVAPEFAEEAMNCMAEQQRGNCAWTGDYANQLYMRLGESAAQAVPQLEAQLADSKERMQAGSAAVALWRIRHFVTPRMVEALAWDVEHGLQRSQIWSMEALKEIGAPAAAAAPSLERMTHHPRIYLRTLASEALASVRAKK